jgi:predicted RNA methylase
VLPADTGYVHDIRNLRSKFTKAKMMADSVMGWYKATLRTVSKVKSSLLPDEIRYHKVWFGLDKGCYFPLNLRHGTRMVLGLYELEVVRYFKAYATRGGCLYDIGARHGYYSLAFSRLAGPARIYAFEADQQNCQVFREVVARNHPNSRIEVFDFFVGREVDEIGKRETLDHLIFGRRFDPPNLIKIDVDGPEYEILSGATKVLAECAPRLIVEVHSPQLEADCKALLEQAGYTVTIVKNNPWLQEPRHIELNRWLAAEPR